MHFTWKQNWEQSHKESLEVELKPPCPSRGHPQLFCWSCHCFHVLFPVQWTLNSFSAYCKVFIWHCWGILPSLQAALNLLADLMPVQGVGNGVLLSRGNWAQIFQTSAGCWSAATSPLCHWVCPTKADTAAFLGHTGTYKYILSMHMHGIVIWGSLGYSGIRNPPLETLHGLGQFKMCWNIGWGKPATFKTENLKLWSKTSQHLIYWVEVFWVLCQMSCSVCCREKLISELTEPISDAISGVLLWFSQLLFFLGLNLLKIIGHLLKAI